MGAGDVLLAESCVGLGDAYELNFRMGGEVVEEALNVAVDEADDGNADRRVCLSEGAAWRNEGGEGESGEQRRDNSKSGAWQSDHIGESWMSSVIGGW
jgi:hypothetical protein